MNALPFLKRSYKTIVFLISVFIFFYGYNFFLVDRSLISLKIALAQAAETKTIDDFHKVSLALKFPIFQEVFSKDISSRQIIALELAGNSAAEESIEVAKNVNFYLREAIKAKETQRPGVIRFFDNLNTLFLKPSVQASQKQIKDKINSVSLRIRATKDYAALQEFNYELARLHVELGNYPEAERFLLEVVKIEPDTKLAIKSRFNLGWLYKITGQDKKAISYFSQLSQEFIDKDKDFAALCQYQAADTFYKKGDFFNARNAYAKLVSDNPDFQSTDFGLLEAGVISLYNLEDIKTGTAFLEAFASYQKGEDFSVNIKEAMGYMKGSAPIEEDNEAIALEGPIVDRQSTDSDSIKKAEELRRAGFELLKKGKYGEAIFAFKQALIILPRDGLTYSGLSLSYYWLKQDRDALAEARRAVEIAPLNELIVANTMFVLINLRIPDETIKVGERIILQRSAIKRPEVYFNLGYAYAMLNKIKEAITYFRMANRLDDNFAFALNNLGVILWSQHKYKEAMLMLTKAIAHNPGYADAHYNLGVIYFNTRRMEEAYHEFELTLDINPDYKDATRYMNFISNYLKQKR